MADVITPDTFSGAFEMPATMSGRRTSQFTKEDLVRALLQTQAQPKSPYSLQFEAPTIAAAPPSGEEQFQRDWDTAMAQYQARIAQPRVLPQGITFGGQTNLDTPQAAFQETLAPLRFQAAQFQPDISREFSQQALEGYRQAEIAHRRALEEEFQKRFELSQKGLDIRQAAQDLREAESAKKQPKPPAFPTFDAIALLKKQPELADQFNATYGEGAAEKILSPTKKQGPLSRFLRGLGPAQEDIAPAMPLGPRAIGPSFGVAPSQRFGLPKVGEVRAGYRFKGGDPADRNNWEAVK